MTSWHKISSPVPCNNDWLTCRDSRNKTFVNDRVYCCSDEFAIELDQAVVNGSPRTVCACHRIYTGQFLSIYMRVGKWWEIRILYSNVSKSISMYIKTYDGNFLKLLQFNRHAWNIIPWEFVNDERSVYFNLLPTGQTTSSTTSATTSPKTSKLFYHLNMIF